MGRRLHYGLFIRKIVLYNKLKIIINYYLLGRVKEPHVHLHQSIHIGDEGKGLEIKVVPFLDDNYGYIIIDESSGSVALVDPADPTTFDEYFEANNITKNRCNLNYS